MNPDDDVPGTVWVETVLDPGEPFRIKVHLNDRSWTLGRDGAIRYALAVLQAAHYADYDSATLQLLVKAGVSAEAAGALIADDLRPDRERLDNEALAPLGLDVGITPGGAPFIMILLDEQPVGQWDVEGAVKHAQTVLSAMFAAGLDAALYQAMVTQVGLEAGRARNVIRGLGEYRIEAAAAALRHLAEKSDGDVRKALTALELAGLTTPADEDGIVRLTLAVAEESIQRKAVVYDTDGDAHYDTASAFIKSIRGSDPDAALYWLAKMLHAGEDPRFISRRLVIAASEDIGLADSNALRVALDAHGALEFVGMPEGRIPLAHATVYLATAPKSNTAYAALGRAVADVENGRTLAVPPHLRTKTRKKLAAASGESEEAMKYLYSHDFEGAYVPQAYLPEGRTYYQAGDQGMEKRIKERLEFWRNANPPD